LTRTPMERLVHEPRPRSPPPPYTWRGVGFGLGAGLRLRLSLGIEWGLAAADLRENAVDALELL
jgi:hypothetical protein